MRLKKKKKIRIKGWVDLRFCGELSFTSITAPTCKATIISLEPCALNADFQHFIPRFNKNFCFMDTPERRVGGERRPKGRDFTNNFSIYTYTPQNITHPNFLHLHVSCCSVYIYFLQLHEASVNFCQMHLHSINSYWHLHTQHWSKSLV